MLSVPDLGKIKDIKEIIKKHNIPIVIEPTFKNGMYVPYNPGKYEKSKNSLINLINTLRNNHKGGIIVGESTYSPTIIAHELGHATNGPSPIRSVTESITNNKYFPFLSTLGALIASSTIPEHKGKILAGNILLNALSTIPTIYDEYSASEKAKQIYDKSNKKLLKEMLLSYVTNNPIRNKLLIPSLGTAVFLGAEQL